MEKRKSRKSFVFYIATMVLLFLLAAGSVGLATWAVIKSQLQIGGNISFNGADKVNATVSAGRVEGGTLAGTGKLTELKFDANNDVPNMSSWSNLELQFNDNGDDVMLNFDITNNSKDTQLLVSAGTVTADSFDNATCTVKMNGHVTTSYVVATESTLNMSVVFEVVDKNYAASITNFVIPFTMENTTDELAQLIANVADDTKTAVYGDDISYSFTGIEFYNQQLTLPAATTPAPDAPTKPPIIVVENITMNQFLSEHASIAEMFIEDNVRPLAITASAENIKSERCYMTSGSEDEELLAVTFAYTEKVSNSEYAYKVVNVTFNSGLSFDNIVDHYGSQSNMGTLIMPNDVEVTEVYSKNFKFEIQTGYQNLTNAICDKVFGESEMAERLIIDNGEMTDSSLGKVRAFTVIEINNYGVHEKSIKIAC